MPTFAAGTLYYVPVTLGANDGNGFQQLVTANSSSYSSYLATNISNINFQDGAGNIIDSWLESGETSSSTTTRYWVALPNGTITTIYYCLYATTANKMNGTTTGAEPNYTGTYQQYDNGTTMFTFYDNFNGSSLNSTNWSSTTGSGCTITVSNGLTVNSIANANAYAYVLNKTLYNSQAYIAECYGSKAVGLNEGFAGFFGYQGTVQGGTPQWYINANSSNFVLWNYNGSSNNFPTILAANTSNHIFSIWTTSSQSEAMIDYANLTTNSQSFTAGTSNQLDIFVAGSSNGQDEFIATWCRLRIIPTTGTMPTATFGSVTPVPSGTKAAMTAVLNSISDD